MGIATTTLLIALRSSAVSRHRHRQRVAFVSTVVVAYILRRLRSNRLEPRLVNAPRFTIETLRAMSDRDCKEKFRLLL